MIVINADKVYVVCPAGSRTGGPELLHQLVFELRQMDKKAFLVYSNISNKQYQILDEYKQYADSYLLLSEIEDSKNNLVIVPEVSVKLLSLFKSIQKAIWWLSVDNFFTANNSFYSFRYVCKRIGLATALYRMLRLVVGRSSRLSITSPLLKEVDFNLCQCEYAMDVCRKNNLRNVVYLSDYINDSFVLSDNNTLKDNIIVYNPKKGARITHSISKNKHNIGTYVPLINLTRAQVSEYMSKAKVYIDFGYHPGKDRMPREAALLDCCIITGTEGSANSKYQDVPIDSKYKFANPLRQKKKVIQLINDILVNYDSYISDFKFYKECIINERQQFSQQVKNLFIIE